MTTGHRVTGLDHVLLAMPAGGEDAARAFYGRLLGLTEVPKPAGLSDHGGCWFVGTGAGSSVAIHLGVEARSEERRVGKECRL